MPVGHVDAAHLLVGLPDHPNLFGRLDEIEWQRRRQQLRRNAARIARLLGGEWKSALAAEHLVVRFLHLLGRPGLEHRVISIADVRRLLTAVPVANIGVGGVWPYRAAAQSR